MNPMLDTLRPANPWLSQNINPASAFPAPDSSAAKSGRMGAFPFSETQAGPPGATASLPNAQPKPIAASGLSNQAKKLWERLKGSTKVKPPETEPTTGPLTPFSLAEPAVQNPKANQPWAMPPASNPTARKNNSSWLQWLREKFHREKPTQPGEGKPPQSASFNPASAHPPETPTQAANGLPNPAQPVRKKPLRDTVLETLRLKPKPRPKVPQGPHILSREAILKGFPNNDLNKLPHYTLTPEEIAENVIAPQQEAFEEALIADPWDPEDWIDPFEREH